MDVHHHSKSEKNGKHLKEYVFEFFMLFLAVTAGFYAENIREKFVERHKEHEYMVTLVGDLQQDSEHLSIAIAQLQSVIPGLDSLARLYYSPQLNDSVQLCMYDLNLRHLKLIPLTFSDRTSSQLKNSGSLRLVKNKQVTDALFNYWQQIDYFNYVSPLNENFRRNARELSFKIFDLGEYDLDRGFNTSSIRHANPQLFTTDKTLLHEYTNYVWAYRTTLNLYYYPPIQKLQMQAKNLIELIKKEYEIE
jgi:hypothetical protein